MTTYDFDQLVATAPPVPPTPRWATHVPDREWEYATEGTLVSTYDRTIGVAGSPEEGQTVTVAVLQEITHDGERLALLPAEVTLNGFTVPARSVRALAGLLLAAADIAEEVSR